MSIHEISRTAIAGHLFSTAMEAASQALRKAHPSASLDQMVLDGHFESVALMLWIAARERTHERYQALRREALVKDFLASAPPSELLQALDAFGAYVYRDLEELWQDRGLVGEGLCALALHFTLGIALQYQESNVGRPLPLSLKPHPTYPHVHDLAVAVSRTRNVVLQVHGHARDRRAMDKAATRRGSWQVYLIPPDDPDLDDLARVFEGPHPPERAYSWYSLVENLHVKEKLHETLRPLSQLPFDLVALAKSER